MYVHVPKMNLAHDVFTYYIMGSYIQLLLHTKCIQELLLIYSHVPFTRIYTCKPSIHLILLSCILGSKLDIGDFYLNFLPHYVISIRTKL